MKIAAVSVVRNAADIIAINLLHHFSSGIDAMYVVDHKSADGTDAVLARAARRFPLRWTRYDGHFVQGEILTELARLAQREGADWIVPIDADEFWWTPQGDLRSQLAAIDAAAINCGVVHFVQRRDVDEPRQQGLLTMTRRPEKEVGALVDAHELVRSRRAAFVEVPFPAKWIVRSSPSLEIRRGSHEVFGVHGRSVQSNEIQCLHAPLRAKSVLGGRVEHGEQLAVMDPDPEIGWQVRWFRSAAAAGTLDAEWSANSYAEESLDVHGRRRPVIEDHRLREICARWLCDELVAGVARDDTPTRPDAVDVEMRECVRVAEVRGMERRLQSAMIAVAERDAIIADVGRSLPGRIYKRLAKNRAVRRLMRFAAGLR